MGVSGVNDIAADVSQIDRGELDERSVAGAPPGDGFFVAIASSARAAMDAHTHSTTDVEVGGVMLGRPYRHGERAFLLIDAIVPALEAEQHGANVTFTAETWTQIHTIIDRDHPGASIVGWYHTHPNFGIFLSEMDVFIQRHFFDLPHQVAIVVDPVAHLEGCFVWRDGVPTRDVLHPEDGPPSPPHVEAREVVPEPIAPPLGALAFARDDDHPPSEFHEVVRRHIARIDAKPNVIDHTRDAARSAVAHLRERDLSQMAALIGLVAITVAIFASLVSVIMQRSPSEHRVPMNRDATTSPASTH